MKPKARPAINRTSNQSLTPRQAAFAAAYARHGVGDRAAVDAGYSAKTSGAQASRLLKNDGVRTEVNRLQSLATSKAEVDTERVVKELALIGFADLADFVEWGEDGVILRESSMLDSAKRRAIVEVSQGANGIKIKLADKNSALDKLGRYLGIFTDKVEHSGAIVTTSIDASKLSAATLKDLLAARVDG